MVKNTGKPSEKLFTEALQRLGKKAYYHRFVDAAEIKGKTGKVATAATAQPSDYIVIIDSHLHFAEVKSTTNKTSFPFSMLNQNQSNEAKKVLAAGGSYWIYVHSLEQKQWYRFPYSLVTAVKEAGKSSIKWQDLHPFIWTLAHG
jgi:penicillin-binding protein-related factor A (putative recombinase)